MFYAGGLEPRLQQRVGDPVQFAAMQRQPPSLPPSLPSHVSSLPSPLCRVLLRDRAQIPSSQSALLLKAPITFLPLSRSLSSPSRWLENGDLARGWLVLRVKLSA